MAEKYDLMVIGAGPGGYVAAIKAAQLGKKVAIAERRQVGGTCLNRGCIPTKTLVHTAELLEEIRSCEKLGIHTGGISIDFEKMHARKAEVVGQLRNGIEGLFQSNKIDLIRGSAKIVETGKVRIGEEVYKADRILLATGSRPLLPAIPGLDLPGVVTSDELLEGAGVACRKMVIIGGGVIGVEFAAIYQALGCEVIIIEAMERILPTLDREISQNLNMILKKRGVKVHTGASVEKVEQDGGLVCHFTAKGKTQSIATECILVSIGRTANTEGLCETGVDLKPDRGRIPVNEVFETCRPGIYAIGDIVKEGIQLAHVASAQGINAVCAMFGETAPMNLNTVPSCIYTNPEIASVGMTADEAKGKEIPVITGKAIMSANGKTVIAMGERGFVKLVFHADTKVLLGAQLMCSRATDLIGGLADAVNNHLTMEQLGMTVRPHPTFCEAIGEAIEDAQGGAIHAAPKRR